MNKIFKLTICIDAVLEMDLDTETKRTVLEQLFDELAFERHMEKFRKEEEEKKKEEEE